MLAVNKENLVLHEIKPGETISKIALKYNVPSGMIVQWNGLTSVHKISAGKQLALYINHGGKRPEKINSVSAVAKKSKRKQPQKTDKIAVLHADKKKTHITNSSNPYRWYRVQNGDSLWTISRKFRTSTADIKKWNNLKSNLIHPGITLKLKEV